MAGETNPPAPGGFNLGSLFGGGQPAGPLDKPVNLTDIKEAQAAIQRSIDIYKDGDLTQQKVAAFLTAIKDKEAIVKGLTVTPTLEGGKITGASLNLTELVHKAEGNKDLEKAVGDIKDAIPEIATPNVNKPVLIDTAPIDPAKTGSMAGDLANGGIFGGVVMLILNMLGFEGWGSMIGGAIAGIVGYATKGFGFNPGNWLAGLVGWGAPATPGQGQAIDITNATLIKGPEVAAAAIAAPNDKVQQFVGPTNQEMKQEKFDYVLNGDKVKITNVEFTDKDNGKFGITGITELTIDKAEWDKAAADKTSPQLAIADLLKKTIESNKDAKVEAADPKDLKKGKDSNKPFVMEVNPADLFKPLHTPYRDDAGPSLPGRTFS